MGVKISSFSSSYLHKLKICLLTKMFLGISIYVTREIYASYPYVLLWKELFNHINLDILPILSCGFKKKYDIFL